MERMKELPTRDDDEYGRLRMSLLTDSYRVDEVITPKLHRLGLIAKQILRLSQPLDMFVIPDDDRNAFCFPSRRGNRLVMGLNAGLVRRLTRPELLSVIGHEIGHALLGHLEIPKVEFGDERFSPLEVIQLRALDRAQEISCDRFGLLACQDVRVASTALFKLASGLSENWFSFDESAYARHFDELSAMAELVNMESVNRTHPLIPLRVKALMGFSTSETFLGSFGKTGALISAKELESSVQTMLSVLSPDLSDFENADDQKALKQFLQAGVLLMIAADGVVEPGEVKWLSAFTEQSWTVQELASQLDNKDFMATLRKQVAESSHVLRHKLPEQQRAGLLHTMCSVALSAGGIPESEFEVLDELREQLGIRVELARAVLEHARENETSDEPEQTIRLDESSDPIEHFFQSANLPESKNGVFLEKLNEVRAKHQSPIMVIREMLCWGIGEGAAHGILNKAQGKRLVQAAIKTISGIYESEGYSSPQSPTPLSQLIRKYGVVSLFRKGEVAVRLSDSEICHVTSVSRTRSRITISPQSDPSALEDVSPEKLRKDPEHGIWPPELS